VREVAVCLLTLILWPSHLDAKHLPVRTYTTADGLARDYVLCVIQDSRGFLWFCTAEGLSRFDGYRFTNYSTAQGLPSNTITSFLETRRGVYWVATTAGVCRFDPNGARGSRFLCRPLLAGPEPPPPRVLYEDPAGNIWCGASKPASSSLESNLFRLRPSDLWFQRVNLPMTDTNVTALAADRSGTIWVGSPEGLYRRDPDGATRRYTTADGLPNPFIMALLEDREGQLWVGTRKGLVRLDPLRPSRMRVYTDNDGLPDARIESLFQSSDGRLWAGTPKGLAEGRLVGDRHEFQDHTLAEGLSANTIGAVAEDRAGDLWIATFGSGVMKVARNGFTSFTAADGLPLVRGLMETAHGDLCAIVATDKDLTIARFDGAGFVPIRPAWPRRIFRYGWGSQQVAVQDHTGEWWIATGQGLARFSAVHRVDDLRGVSPKAIYTVRDGLPGNDIFRVFEDSHGDIWIGAADPGLRDSLARWDRATGRIHAFSQADGLPWEPLPTSFAEDRTGTLWISLYHESLARYRNGRFTTFTAADGMPGFINALYIDSAGRLWIAGSQGLMRVDEPGQDRPRFITYTSAHGLSSDDIAAVTEDRWGRIYAGTGRGIDRFEPQPSGIGHIEHYTTADGIVSGELELAFRDRRGTLWFSTPLGLSQFTPRLDAPHALPPVLVTGISVGGVPYPISDLGESAVSGLKLPRSSLRFDFVGLTFAPGETLRYQYMLDGADSEWSAPTDQRSVLYANLAARSYRFLVRAVTGEGAISPQPAVVAFAIPPPFWRTGWFLLGCAAFAALILYGLDRYRMARVLAIARIRARIATDLHDDIASSLSQIAILSEVAQSSPAAAGGSHGGTLAEIAGISRELIDSMSDIVWAINPDHDHLTNLVYRMRRFAADVLTGQHIELQFRCSVAEHDLRVGAKVRREVYLIFKEAVHNIVRHSAATRVEVELDRVDGCLALRLCDNGKGFDPCAAYDGRGLRNMRKRAGAVNANVELQSARGQGTVLRMTVRLNSTRTLSMLRGK
jgi:ligand-binding sensor domain-containing protein/signal transduction histidine kinase